jgi:hypothetical protein
MQKQIRVGDIIHLLCSLDYEYSHTEDKDRKLGIIRERALFYDALEIIIRGEDY